MPPFAARLAAAAVLALITTGLAARGQDPDLVVHEWGTFTTVAGVDGAAAQWLPLGGPQDLPCFVHRFQDSQFKVLGGAPPLNYEQARASLLGTVRMETPVLYFYSPRETEVNVSVRFTQGLMTEWFPKAAVQQPLALAGAAMPGGGSVLTWNQVRVRPGASPNYPREAVPSHYYAARATDAAPVQLNGQDEKFLFYRGIGSFQVPLKTSVTTDGRITIANTGAAALPAVVLFENRNGRLGYRVAGELAGTVTLDRPGLSSDLASLARALEVMLVATGLYAREAEAMVETWRDSWFEEGTRVFYIVPPATVDEMLPLSVTPAPARIVRGFVGRMEIITPEIVAEVRDAIAEADDATLKVYGRFLGQIGDRIAAIARPDERARTQAVLERAYTAFVSTGTTRCK